MRLNSRHDMADGGVAETRSRAEEWVEHRCGIDARGFGTGGGRRWGSAVTSVVG
jgi:hypothetical protein